jgi:hypothetical protein
MIIFLLGLKCRNSLEYFESSVLEKSIGLSNIDLSGVFFPQIFPHRLHKIILNIVVLLSPLLYLQGDDPLFLIKKKLHFCHLLCKEDTIYVFPEMKVSAVSFLGIFVSHFSVQCLGSVERRILLCVKMLSVSLFMSLFNLLN